MICSKLDRPCVDTDLQPYLTEIVTKNVILLSENQIIYAV